jgi:hypothetical protein
MLDIRLRVKCERTIEKGEILDLYPEEIYMKSGYGNSCLMIETTVCIPTTVQKVSESVIEKQ